MSFKLLLLDLDDTLCDYTGARALRLRNAFQRALSDSRQNVEDLEAMIAESIRIQPHGSDHFGALLRRYGVDDVAAARSREWYQTNRFHGLNLFAGARELLRDSRSADPNRKIGLITNGPADVQRAKIELLELAADVDFALISGEFGAAKPDPSIFREAMRLGGATEAETLMVGDSPEFDITGAHAVGIPAVWVNRGNRPWPLPGPRPEYEIRTIEALTSLFDPEGAATNPRGSGIR